MHTNARFLEHVFRGILKYWRCVVPPPNGIPPVPLFPRDLLRDLLRSKNQLFRQAAQHTHGGLRIPGSKGKIKTYDSDIVPPVLVA